MNDKTVADRNSTNQANNDKWLKETLKQGVYDLVDQEIFDAFLVEAKPAWVLPGLLLVGKIRNKGSAASTRWFICGDCETSHTPEGMAATPRDAARHFALSWQAKLGEQLEASNSEHQTRVQQAEALYELTQVDNIWNNTQLL